MCGAVLLLIPGALYFDYYAWNTYLFGSSVLGNRRVPLIEKLMDKKREKQKNKRKEEEKIEKAKKLEEYLKNKKSPSEYLSLLGKEKFYFVSYSQSTSSENGIYEVEIINNVPVLHRIELINGEKTKLYDIVLDEQFDNPYLPDWNSRVYNCDFAFFNRYSDNKDNLDNISSYLKFLEEDGEIKIWAHDGYDNSNLIYETENIENILSEFNSDRPKNEIKYTGKYIYEKIEIIKNFDRSDPNFTPEAAKEINIAYTSTNNLIMYYDDDSEWRFIEINDRDINEPYIGLFAADGGGGSASTYIYFKNDYLIYHSEFWRYDMETEELKYDVKYEVYYKKTNAPH